MKNWTLIDEGQGILLTDFEFATDFGSADEEKQVELRLKNHVGGQSEGVRSLEVKTGELCYTVLPTRGMSLWKAARNGVDFGWQSPIKGPVHPNFVPLYDPSGLGWLDGFDELFVRCGLQSNGAPEFHPNGQLATPLHGLIANKPARSLRVEFDEENGVLAVEGVVEEARFHFAKLQLRTRITTKLGSNRIEIADEVVNMSASPTDVQLLYHINFGSPLLEQGAKLIAPLEEVVPRNPHAASGLENWQTYRAPQAGFEEQVYFLKLLRDEQNRSYAILKGADGQRAAGIEYSAESLPCFSVWKNETSLEDGYVTGLEPGTNFPNPKSFEREQGRVVELAGQDSFKSLVALELMTQANEVAAAEKRVQAIQGSTKTILHQSPQSGWCADG